MTINEMIKAMEKTNRELKALGTELKYKQPEKFILFERCIKHNSEWAFYLTQRVITNYKKDQITSWFKQSKIAVKRIERLMA